MGWGRKKRSTDEATAALPEDIEEVNHAPRDGAAESGPHGYYGWGGYGWGGYRGYYGYPYYRGYYGWGRKKRSTDDAVAALPEDIEEVNHAPRDEAAESGPHGYYGWGGYGWGGYRGYYGYPYYRGYGWYGRKKRSTDEATAALPEDIEEVNHAPRDEAAESGPH